MARKGILQRAVGNTVRTWSGFAFRDGAGSGWWLQLENLPQARTSVWSVTVAPSPPHLLPHTYQPMCLCIIKILLVM